MLSQHGRECDIIFIIIIGIVIVKEWDIDSYFL